MTNRVRHAILVAAAMSAAACVSSTPAVKTVEEVIGGTRGRILIAGDGTICRPDFSSPGAVAAVYAAKPGDRFECRWEPGPRPSPTPTPAEAVP